MLNWTAPPARTALVSVAVAALLVGMWQAGLIFRADATTVDGPQGPDLEVFAASTDVETQTPQGLSVGLEAGNLAPNFEFSAFDGRRLSLADFRGRPVLLNFWASWCAPCRAEMPDMQTMLELYGADDGLAVIGVNAGEALAPAQKFIDRLEVEFTAFAYDPEAAIARLYAVRGLPVSYFIDSSGVITHVVAGQLSFEVMEASVLELIGDDLAASD